MKTDYKKILNFMLESGKRLNKRAGNIEDIGITKTDLTEEDLAIERGFERIIGTFEGEHLLYAEEENDIPRNSKHVWIVDPISGTSIFIKGKDHYSISVAYTIGGQTVFAAVYDPSVDEMFTAYLGKGASLNGKSICISKGTKNVILRVSSGWKDPDCFSKMYASLGSYTIENNSYSVALNYCWVASGKFDGLIMLTKDSFPDFAGSFIVQEAGGICTNIDGNSSLNISDRIFVGGNQNIYETIFPIISSIAKEKNND